MGVNSSDSRLAHVWVIRNWIWIDDRIYWTLTDRALALPLIHSFCSSLQHALWLLSLLSLVLQFTTARTVTTQSAVSSQASNVVDSSTLVPISSDPHWLALFSWISKLEIEIEVEVEVEVTLRPMVSWLLCLGVGPPSEAHEKFLFSDYCGFLDVWRPLRREDGSVIFSYNYCWALPEQSLSGPSWS
jgi:hypothetical protein